MVAGQYSAKSIALSELALSSIVSDEARSGANAALTGAVQAGRLKHVNILEVDNVCDGGTMLFGALLAHQNRSV